MIDTLIGIVASIGTLFILFAAIGMLRMPDIYLRLAVTTKAATLGVGLLLVASAMYFSDLSTTTRVLAIILFILLTAPVGAHLIGRAAYIIGIKMWDKSHIDELEGGYERHAGKYGAPKPPADEEIEESES